MKYWGRILGAFIIVLVVVSIKYGFTDDFSEAEEDHSSAFSFYMDTASESRLYSSKGISYALDPVPRLSHLGEKLILKKMEVRGQSVLNFRRKSFSIEAVSSVHIYNSSLSRNVPYNSFKLLGLQYDYTYIENRVSHKLLEKVKLWNLNSGFTELFINSKHQGLYMFVEDPVEYAFRRKNATYILRRGYNHEVLSSRVNFKKTKLPPEVFQQTFDQIYEDITELKGKNLYKKLSEFFNINNYMRKMVMDLILGNGDYADEIFFFARETKTDKIYFDIIPWVYDDVFEKKPHEVARKWNGTCFGYRYYPTHDDLLKALNGRLVFSIEDDLDYIISKDNYLYSRYLDIMELVLAEITIETIDSCFAEVKKELDHYYQIPEVIEQSKYDNNPTSYELFENNLAQKSAFLKERIEWLNSELKIQKEADFYRKKR